MSKKVENTLRRLRRIRGRVKRISRNACYRTRKVVYLAIWGERLWFKYPPERWWSRRKYIIKWRLAQLGNLVFSLLASVVIHTGVLAILLGIYLVTTPATAWVERGEDSTLILHVSVEIPYQLQR